VGFYEEVSNYYDFIFPVLAPQMNFLTRTLGREGKTVLDIACATGGYAAALAQMGFDVTAFDLDGSMMEACRRRMEKVKLDVRTFQGNMLDVGSIEGTFDLAFCIGNSMVHLHDEEEVKTFLRGCAQVLNPEGRLVVQIVNYDRILDEDVKSLPTIFNSEAPLTFERLYEYDAKTGKMMFTGKLEVGKTEKKQFENTVALLPVRAERLVELFDQCGFEEVELFGDFMKKPFDPKTSLHAVVRGRI
jgi:2-polyprenyl-3-methyl-5-hydroxy-6-metoxy-1,4-benzoquinol methylase